MKFCLNGKFYPSSQKAGVDCEKDAKNFSRGAFETLRTYHGNKIFAKNEHLVRLWNSAEMLSIPIDKKRKKEIEKSLDEAAKYNSLAKTDLRIKVVVFADYFWITTETLIPLSPESYTKGVTITDETFDRPFAIAKYTTPAYQKFIKTQGQAFETIFFDTAGFLREGNISNVFAVLDEKIVTPEKNILHGVTREKVIELIHKLHLPFEEQEIHREDLLQASEIFLTNTTKEIVPVSEWGAWNAKSLDTAKKLREEFQKII